MHACAEECSIARLTALIDKKTNAKSKKAPMFVKSGAVITCIVTPHPHRARASACPQFSLRERVRVLPQLECEQPVCIESFDSSPQLGRFTLRDEGKTIGIGKCLTLMDVEERESSS